MALSYDADNSPYAAAIATMDGMNAADAHHPHPLAEWIGQTVIFDTAGPIIYLGTLREIRAEGYWLDEVDVHDCREGHACKELYICEARECGVRAARQRVFVFRDTVISAARLDDVIVD
jgi:hypothetical protein